MSNVIDFLERFGQDAGLRYASDADIEAALREAGIDPAVRTAIVNCDQRALELLLGADTNVCCVVNAPDQEEEEEEEEDEEEEEEEGGEEKGHERSLRRTVERAA